MNSIQQTLRQGLAAPGGTVPRLEALQDGQWKLFHHCSPFEPQRSEAEETERTWHTFLNTYTAGYVKRGLQPLGYDEGYHLRVQELDGSWTYFTFYFPSVYDMVAVVYGEQAS
jgi:hypothetical protein